MSQEFINPSDGVVRQYLAAERLDVRWVDETPAHRDGGRPVPLVSVSASRKDGRVLVSLTNLDAEQERTVRLDLRGGEITGSRGTLLTGDALNAHNSVEHPEAVVPAAFDGYSLTDGVLEVTLPRASFATVSLGWAGEPTMSTTAARPSPATQIGRASCRERV